MVFAVFLLFLQPKKRVTVKYRRDKHPTANFVDKTMLGLTSLDNDDDWIDKLG